MSAPVISLINLADHFPYDLDDHVRDEICFSETLIVSCCHGAPKTAGDSESTWTCEESIVTKEETPAAVKSAGIIVPPVPEEHAPEEEDGDFHFFFYDQLAKRPPPDDNDCSVLIIDDRPQINPNLRKGICRCDSKGKVIAKCRCKYTACLCGNDVNPTCKCDLAATVCVCHPDGEPRPICDCHDRRVCLCDNKEIRIRCTCMEQPNSVCLCATDGSSSPVCVCGNPDACLCRLHIDGHVRPICPCAIPKACLCRGELAEFCVCGHPEACTCHGEMLEFCTCGNPDACICKKGVIHNVCSCEFDDACLCNNEISQFCTCGHPEACTCQKGKMLPFCVCGHPEACLCKEGKMLEVCDCGNIPCTCHKGQPREKCTCEDSELSAEDEEAKKACVCPPLGQGKKKRKRNKGYYKCYETDPKHTYFDFAYDRCDKIQETIEKPPSKIEITDCREERPDDHVCQQAPKDKYVRIPNEVFSLDCCQATGGLCVSIETMGKNKERFLIQVISQFSKEGAETMTKLVSTVDRNMHTLEEKRHERISKYCVTKARNNYICMSPTGYYSKLTNICNEKKKVHRLEHSFEVAHDFVLEGANMLLLRYFAIKRFKGEFSCKTVLMNGSVCTSTYVSSGVSQGIVNGKPMFVVKVDRTITEPCGIVHNVHTVLTLKGYIVTHDWDECNYVIHINPLLQVFPDKNEIEVHSPLRKKWQEDLELFNNFIQFKSACKGEASLYVSDHPEVHDMLSDYLKSILMLKPEDVLHFTRHYFSSFFDVLDMPHSDFYDPCSKGVHYHDFED